MLIAWGSAEKIDLSSYFRKNQHLSWLCQLNTWAFYFHAVLSWSLSEFFFSGFLAADFPNLIPNICTKTHKKSVCFFPRSEKCAIFQVCLHRPQTKRHSHAHNRNTLTKQMYTTRQSLDSHCQRAYYFLCSHRLRPNCVFVFANAIFVCQFFSLSLLLSISISFTFRCLLLLQWFWRVARTVRRLHDPRQWQWHWQWEWEIKVINFSRNAAYLLLPNDQYYLEMLSFRPVFFSTWRFAQHKIMSWRIAQSNATVLFVSSFA